MRNLTIQRQKSFVACAVKDKIYVEDPAGDTNIDGTTCRKLGEVKNGETVNLLISDYEQRIFLIQDMVSKDWCYEVYPVPAGTADLLLVGKHHYNPAKGNPFRFENNPSPMVQEVRKKNGKRAIWIMIGAAILGGLIGFLTNYEPPAGNDPKTFTDEGMSIVLTEGFKSTSVDGYNFAFESRDAVVFGLKEPFTLMEGFENYTIEEYGQLIIDNNELDSGLQTKDGTTYLTYTGDVDGTQYHYTAYLYKAGDAFWMIQFATTSEKAPTMADSIHQWASSVTFEN